MNRSFRQSAFFYFVAAPLCWLACVFGNGMAQTTTIVAQAGCSGGVTPDKACMDRQTSVSESGIAIAPPAGAIAIGIGPPGAGFIGMQDDVQIVKNAPYQAQAITEIKQTLANGSHIVQTTTATVARDSEGRTVRIQKLGEIGPIGPWMSTTSSKGNSPVLTTIFNPVSRTHIDFTSDSKIARMVTLPALLPLPPHPAEAGSAAIASGQVQGFVIGSGSVRDNAAMNGFAVTTQRFSLQGGGGGNEKTKPLGTKTIDGIRVVGTRSVSTIPKGTIGNDRDIVVIHETWYSPELKLVLRSIHDDPRFGQTTYSLTNIQRREPDKALFQVPAGYKIEKLPPPQTRRIMSHP